MRSLYTDDINGSQSKVTIFQKSRFKEKYTQFARSNQKNPEHKKYEWYTSPRQLKNTQKTFFQQPRYTLKLMSEHTGLSRSGHFQQLKNLKQYQSSKNDEKSQLFRNSGQMSMGELSSARSKEQSSNPYFPHRYVGFSEQKAKYTGNRSWNYDSPEKIDLPNITKSKLCSYF